MKKGKMPFSTGLFGRYRKQTCDMNGEKMNKTVKKILSLFMVLALVAVLIPTMTPDILAAPTIGDAVSSGKKVTFTYDNASATDVYVAGDFNGWSSSSADWKLEKNAEGVWELTQTIASGVYAYKFVVDGSWERDPGNNTYYPDSDNSKLAVPGTVTSPIINGNEVTFNFPVSMVPSDATKVVIKGGFNGWAEEEMTLSGDHYTFTVSDLVADTYEYGINVYTSSGPSYGTFYKDYYNMEAVSLGGNSIFTIQATEQYPEEDPNVQSPIVNGQNVTFNLYAPGAASVYVAGSMTTPVWNDGMEAMTYDEATGYWSVTLENVTAGTYEYKFVKNGNWIVDPLNSESENGNSIFTIVGEEESSTEEESSEEESSAEEESSEEEESSIEEESSDEEESSAEEESSEEESSAEEESSEEEESSIEEESSDEEESSIEEDTTAEEDSTVEEDNRSNIEILEGVDGQYSGTGTYVLRINNDIDKFVEVLVDETVVESSNYTVTEGSTIITFSENFLKSLSEGKHIVRVNFTDGYAETTLTIEKSAAIPSTTADKTASVNTGDVAPTALLLVILASAVAVVIVSKKRQDNE